MKKRLQSINSLDLMRFNNKCKNQHIVWSGACVSSNQTVYQRYAFARIFQEKETEILVCFKDGLRVCTV